MSISINYKKLFGSRINKKTIKDMKLEFKSNDLLKDLPNFTNVDSTLERIVDLKNYEKDFILSYKIGELMYNIREKLFASEAVLFEDVKQLNVYVNNIKNDSTKKEIKLEVEKLVNINIKRFNMVLFEMTPLLNFEQKQYFFNSFLKRGYDMKAILGYGRKLELPDIVVDNMSREYFSNKVFD